MKKKQIALTGLVLFISSALWFSSCQKNEEPGAITEKGNVEFSLNLTSLKNLMATKAAYSMEDATAIILTIEHSDGSPTDFTATTVNLYNLSGNFFSATLPLTTGDYQLTRFVLVNGAGDVIFACPNEGTPLEANVSDAAPMAFNVSKDNVAEVTVEVLSTETLSPEDFGFVTFNIVEVPTFSFLLTVFELGSNELLRTDITVENGSYVYTQTLDSITGNQVKVKDAFTSYNLTVEHAGHQTYTNTFTDTELKSYTNVPLVVELAVDSFPATVTDVDGNVYQTIQIGNQVWMAENLKATRYNDDTPIPNIQDNIIWSNLTTGAYCWYDNDPATYENTYGKLYNWYAVNTSNLCPTGWHVPADAEWRELEMFLGMSQAEADIEEAWRGTNEGGKLKESGTVHWLSPNTGATNETGFTALPGGYRNWTGLFGTIGNFASFWSTTESSETYAWFRDINTTNSSIYRGTYSKKDGFSVRCVKD